MSGYCRKTMKKLHFDNLVFACALICITCTSCAQAPRAAHNLSLGVKLSPRQSDDFNQPISFGYKIGWLALRTEDTKAVAQALHMSNTQQATWKQAFNLLQEQENADAEQSAPKTIVFVSPPTKRWTLVVGFEPESPGKKYEDRESLSFLEREMTELSKPFGDAQAFGSHRVTEFHYWLTAKNGILTRSFAYSGESGEVLKNLGHPSSAEKFPWKELSDSWFPDEDSVLKVASGWSIDPRTLDKLPKSKSLGIIGAVNRSTFPAHCGGGK